jgi:hypothetical protein
LQGTEIFLRFVRAFNAIGVRYMITGSSAAMIYGEPRMTNDVDLVLEIPDDALPSLQVAFPQTDYYCPPLEVLHVETHRNVHGHFNLIHTASGFKADVYPVGTDTFQRWALENVRTVMMHDVPVPLAPPEYVIIRKLEYYREGGSDKHLRDVRGMLAVSGEMVDRALVEREVVGRGLDGVWGLLSGE